MQKLEEVQFLLFAAPNVFKSDSHCMMVFLNDEQQPRNERIQEEAVARDCIQRRNINVSPLVPQISVVGDPVMNVNCRHVQSFDAELYRQLTCYPQVKLASSAIICLFFFHCCCVHYVIRCIREYGLNRGWKLEPLMSEMTAFWFL